MNDDLLAQADRTIDQFVSFGIFKPVRAWLISQHTLDGWDITDAPIGTEYTAFLGSEHYCWHSQEGRSEKRRLFVWVRGGVTNTSGKMPREVLRYENENDQNHVAA